MQRRSPVAPVSSRARSTCAVTTRDHDAGSKTATRSHDVEALVGYRLRRLHQLFADHWRTYFGANGVGITPVQGGILLVIADQPGLSQAELARHMGIETPTLHESIKRLVAAELVVRQSSPHDRRLKTLSLTPAGMSVSHRINAGIAAQEADALSALSVEERRQLADLLGRALGLPSAR